MVPRSAIAPLVLLLLLLAPAAVGGASHPATLVAPPLHAGYRWTYADGAGHTIQYIVGGEGAVPSYLGNGTAIQLLRVGTEQGRTTIQTSYLEVGSLLVLGRADLVYGDQALARSTVRFDPPANLLGYPLTPGTSWTVNVTEHDRWNITPYDDPSHPQTGSATHAFRTTFHVGNWTTVATPAGNVSALLFTEVPQDAVSRSEGLSIVRYASPTLRLYARIDQDRPNLTPWRRYNLTSAVDDVPPTAIITGRTAGLYQRVPINLSARSSYDPDDAIRSVRWDLGDGSNATTWNVSHVYAHPGRFLVTLTVTDARNLTTTASRTLVVRDRLPVPVLDAPAHVDPGVPFNVSGAGSHDPDGTVVAWAWSFGDGTRAKGRNVTHAYARNGAYVVHLTVTDDTNATATAVKTVLVGNATAKVIPVTTTLLAPSQGAKIWGTTNVTWRVTGNASVVYVDVDGRTLWNGPPANRTTLWNATAAGAGPHRIQVGAIDASGGVHEATVVVTATPPASPASSASNATVPPPSPPSTVGHPASNPVPASAAAALGALFVAGAMGRLRRRKL